MNYTPEQKASWEEVIRTIENSMNRQPMEKIQFDTWIRPLKLHAVTHNSLIIIGEDAFKLQYVKNRYGTVLYSTVNMVFHRAYELDFRLPGDVADEQEIKVTTLNDKYTFENFIVGPSNNFAFAASLAVADAPSEVYNPLFIYGGVGLGKTHLMNAIGNFIAGSNPWAKVLFISSETFTNDLIDSIVKKQGTSELRSRMRNVDVLMVDDIQFLSRTVATQEEFFHTFNDLYNKGKQIIISSDRPPKEIPTIEERLRSRFEWGLTVDIQKPDYETRVAILRRRAAEEDIEAPDEVLEYIAEQVDSNIRELEGSLVRVNAQAELLGTVMTLEMAQEALAKLLPSREARKVTPELIVAQVAAQFGVSEEDLYSKRRSREIANARQVAMYLIRSLTQLSTTAVGTVFGGRDHTTVMHGCEKVEESLRTDAQLRRTVENLKNELKGK